MKISNNKVHVMVATAAAASLEKLCGYFQKKIISLKLFVLWFGGLFWVDMWWSVSNFYIKCIMMIYSEPIKNVRVFPCLPFLTSRYTRLMSVKYFRSWFLEAICLVALSKQYKQLPLQAHFIYNELPLQQHYFTSVIIWMQISPATQCPAAINYFKKFHYLVLRFRIKWCW